MTILAGLTLGQFQEWREEFERQMKAKVPDIHKAMAAWFYKVPIEEVTISQRIVAKQRNYIFLYSQERDFK